MGSNLHRLLRSFCLGTDWKYAIFWKLKHRARIIVGQVAVTGKHRWICVDNQVTSSVPSFEFADGWQSQFSAGIRTIVVIAVVPLGVVQLGSLNKMDSETSESVPAYLQTTEKTMKHELLDNIMPFQCPGNNDSPHAVYEKTTVDVAKHEGPELNSDGSSILLQSMSNMMNVEQQKLLGMRPVNERKFEGNSSGREDTSVESGKKLSSFLHNLVTDNNGVNDLVCPSENAGVNSVSFSSDFLDTVVCESEKFHYVDINQKGVKNWSRPLDAYSQKDTGMSKFQTEPCSKDTTYTLKFPAGYELHEALGPSFLKESKYFDWAVKANQDVKATEISDEISCSQLTSEPQREHLLEAMVANIGHNNNVNSKLSVSATMQAAIASGGNPEGSIHTVHTINSESCSIDQPHLGREEKHYSLSSSGICGIMSPKGFSSTCPSSCSEQFERSSEPTKNSKKRARPGESCRPRPRDRQLIQDRIKELRELVPNGAKCSIDSLLECTIKHMLFLKNVTKHADKLNKFGDTKTKLHHIQKDINGSSSYQQGSSWAMEVGGHLKVCSILVENLNKNGQMLVEMLCEECSHFLEIAEAIRSMGLTILNGATEAHGEKTCICFVVEGRSEGQNNRNLHRLDILWPLVQLLQSKSTMHS
ncbi:transcription factor EMB1444-like isoform X6 [Phaseolus vulgaris]|uniref:transcription factor EMB1444-like isoform X6 n=1 Tax=Phaseolus vulgaris TaxID=3885 RepID=UPI0035C9FA2B